MTSSKNSWKLSATELATLVSTRQITARQVAEEALSRLEQVNPKINAIVEYRPEEVMEQAISIDNRIANGDKVGPLAGVPVTIKVILDQVGYATTNGLKSQKDLVATTNNPVVQSFIDADALLLGRTNTPAFSYRWFTNNLLHGHTANPRNASLTPGGSSGGAGAAAASGIGAIACGTDIAGSVRYPAYACGIHGLRPSRGRVATFNASGPERNIGAQLMSEAGPLARTVSDLRLALEAMSRPDPRDIWWQQVPSNLPVPLKRAAVCVCPGGIETAPELIQTLIEAADKLRDSGWIVEEVDDLPPLKEAIPIHKTLWFGADFSKLLKAAEEEGDPGALCLLENNREFAESLKPDALSRALIDRAQIVRQWLLFMNRYSLVLLPPSAELPFKDELDLEDVERVWRSQLSMIALPLTGLPCASVSTGLLNGNIPVGVQLVAGPFREDICLSAAEAIEARSPRMTIAEP